MFWPMSDSNRKPVGDYFRKFDEMENIFGNLFSDFSTAFDDYQYYNNDGDLIKEIEVPGFNKDNLAVEVSDSDGILIIKGERKNNEGVERKIFKRYRLGAYESADAEIKDGILYLTIKTPKDKMQKIELK